MNLLLINPSQEGVYGNFKPIRQIPMGLAYLAAIAVRENCHTRVMDIDAQQISPNYLANHLRKGNFQIVGITATTPTYDNSIELARLVKKESPSSIVILGGIHVTLRPEEAMQHDCVDVVVRGEGEEVFSRLIHAVRNGSSLENVPSIVFRSGSKIITTDQAELIPDLDQLPFPARHVFDNQEYTYPDTLHSRSTPIMTSRGCPGRCTYCMAKQIFTRRFRARSAVNVVDEIEHLARQGIKEIHVWDDNFVTNRKRVREIVQEIERRGIKLAFAFPNGIRADFVNLEVLQLLKRMGAYSVALGVESGSQSVLDRCQKGIRLEQIEAAVAEIRGVGLELWAFFLLGLIGDTPETIAETIEFAKRIDPDVAKFHVLKPYPGSEVYRQLSEQGRIRTDDFRQYGIHTPPVHDLPGLSAEDLLDWQRKAYREFYLRPSQLLRQACRMRSRHRIVSNVKAGIGLMKFMLQRGRSAQ